MTVEDPPVPSVLVRSIIVGFGYKLGVELGKMVTSRFKRDERKKDADDEEDVPDGITTVSPEDL